MQFQSRSPGEKVFIPDDDRSIIVVVAFLNVDVFTVPDSYPGPKAGQTVKVTHRIPALECPCCGKNMVHLWSDNIGIIECITSGKFYCYEVHQSWLDAANRNGKVPEVAYPENG